MTCQINKYANLQEAGKIEKKDNEMNISDNYRNEISCTTQFTTIDRRIQNVSLGPERWISSNF